MSCSRRQLLRGGAAAAALAAIGVRPAWADASSFGAVDSLRAGAYPQSPAERVDADVLKKLALEAIGAAKDAGAQYADVRLTRSVSQLFQIGSTTVTGTSMMDTQYVAVGVRVLINNAWGFASSPFWRIKEMPILAKSAAEQARANSVAARQSVDMGRVPPATGSWITPIRIDPFTIPVDERIDFMTSWMEIANNAGRNVSHGMATMQFKRQERALATTDGTFVTQTLYETGGQFPISVSNVDWRMPNSHAVFAEGLGLAGAGWELFLDANIPEQIPGMVERSNELLSLRPRAVELGRYDLVLSAAAVGQLLSATIGAGTELDRAMGFEANTDGTSYISPPLDVLNRGMIVGSPRVTVLGNRSMPGGLATVRWDDEGVEPDTFTLVNKGVINDFQTTREQAPWLAPWYKLHNRPIRSHGCSNSDSAMRVQMQHSCNIELKPAESDVTFDGLVAGTQRGLAIFGSNNSMDFQLRSGFGTAPLVREIVRGKLGTVITGVAYNSSSGIWKLLSALGGAESARNVEISRLKGEPMQNVWHTVRAVPAVFKNVSVFDIMRRA